MCKTATICEQCDEVIEETITVTGSCDCDAIYVVDGSVCDFCSRGEETPYQKKKKMMETAQHFYSTYDSILRFHPVREHMYEYSTEYSINTTKYRSQDKKQLIHGLTIKYSSMFENQINFMNLLECLRKLDAFQEKYSNKVEVLSGKQYSMSRDDYINMVSPEQKRQKDLVIFRQEYWREQKPLINNFKDTFDKLFKTIDTDIYFAAIEYEYSKEQYAMRDY